MNHDQCRAMKLVAAKALKNCKAYVLVTFDGSKMPVFHYDIRACDNQQDIRHIVMHGISIEVDRQLQDVGKILSETIENMKAAEAKQKRSEELSAFGPDGLASSGVVDSGCDIQGSDGVKKGKRKRTNKTNG